MQKKNLIFYVIFLTIYCYDFSKTQQLTLAYNEYHTVLQYMGVIMIGIGVLLFYVSRRLFLSISARKAVLMFFNVIYGAAMLYMMFVPGKAYITWMIHLSLGYLGGMVFYYISAALGRTDYIGRVAMLGHSFAILLQMLIPKHMNDTGIVLVALIIGFIMVTYLMLYPPAERMFDEMLPYAEETPTWNREIRLRITELLIIVILADAFGCLVETTWTTAWEKGLVDMYTYPRLLMIAGYITAGFLADFWKQKYFDAALMAVLALDFAGVYIKGHETFGLCIFYYVAGFIILYVNIRFCKMAPYTNKPELWAGFGRLLFIYEGMVSEMFIWFAGKDTFYALLILSIIYGVIVYHVMKESQYKTLKEYAFGEKEEEPEAKRFIEYAIKHDLTPRESDVLQVIINSDDTMKSIAESLNISERMLYNYMKQLYEKLGAENRAGLVRAYYEETRN